MPVKPVILVNHLYEPKNRTTGISNYLFALLAALLQRGDFSYVLATNWDAAELPADLQRGDLRVETLNLPDSTPVNIARQTLLLPKLMRKYGAALEFNPNPVGGLAKTWPLVLTVHDLYFDVAPRQYKPHHLLWWRILFPCASRAAQRIICVSEQTRADLVRFHHACAGKAVVVLEAATLAPEEPVRARRKRHGLFVANVSPNKGGDILVEALDLLRRRSCPMEILHVGRDNGVFTAAQARLGTSAGPRLLGKVDAGELAELYANALFLAFPSTYEGFGLPVLEAQAFGTPVIATDIPVLREVAGDGALYFRPADSVGLADHMATLAGDPGLWRRMHDAALRNAARFSWVRAAEETADIFREVLESSAIGSLAHTSS